MDRRILFVDDEPFFLTSMKRLFFSQEYETFYAESGQKALELLEDQPVDLVVSDMKMPEMDGYAFLRTVKQKYPDIIRMMLSGYSDERETIKALQDGTVKLFLTKPWESQQLLNTIERIFATSERLKEQNLLSFMNRTSLLPTIPAIYDHICELVEGDASLEQIASEIEQQDPAIAAKILQVSNSALWAVKTGSVKQAIMFLGLSNIKPIILATAVFDPKGLTASDRKIRGELWQRARLTNRSLCWVYNAGLQKKVPDTYSAAGLLHEVGRIAMLGELGTVYVKALEVDARKERETFGVSHLEVGGSLLSWWNLPLALVEAAMYYEDPLPEQSTHQELVAAVHLSHQAARLALRPDAVMPAATRAVLESFHMTEAGFIRFATEELRRET